MCMLGGQGSSGGSVCVCECVSTCTDPGCKDGALAGVAAGSESGLHLCAVAKVSTSLWGRSRGRGRSGGGCLNTTTTSSVSNSNSICRRKKCVHSVGNCQHRHTQTHSKTYRSLLMFVDMHKHTKLLEKWSFVKDSCESIKRERCVLRLQAGYYVISTQIHYLDHFHSLGLT